MTDQAEENPLEQLIELFVYAPIGMLYEYPEVLPKLIKKGKSQVQLAKFFGQMAARQKGGFNSPSDGGPPGGQTADAVVQLAARVLTEIGAQVGLAPSSTPTPTPAPTVDDPAVTPEQPAPEPLTPAEPANRTTRLPIAGYDDLTAKEIIGLLEDLTHDQLVRVRDHELANRGRKTVLAKIERLVS